MCRDVCSPVEIEQSSITALKILSAFPTHLFSPSPLASTDLTACIDLLFPECLIVGTIK